MRTIVLVGLAILCGASAAVGVSQINSLRAGAAVETVSVVIAAQDVPRGGVLEPISLKIQQWPKSLVPKGALAKVEDGVGRTAVSPLVRGELLLSSKITDKAAATGLASMIAPGMRAFTIRTPHVAAGVGGFVLPGNRVDVLLTTNDITREDGSGGGATTTLLQNVEVLAVDQRLDAADATKTDPDTLKSVTLLVTPDQAAKVDLGMNKGMLHLSLRNPADQKEAATRPATMADLRFHQERPAPMAAKGESQVAAAPTPPAPPVIQYSTIRTLRGEARNMLRIDAVQ
jgi:pilus assembly protein CpaB